MTIKNRIKILILGLVLGLTSTAGAGLLGYATAHGDTGSGSGSAIAPPPADSHALPTPTANADQLHDPVAQPAAAFDDLAAAKKLGWPILVLVVLIIASRLLARLGGMFKVLGTGKVALGIAAGGAFAVAAYNAIALGGTWFAAIAAAMVAGFAAWDAAAKPKAA